MRGPFFPRPCQYLLFVDSSIITVWQVWGASLWFWFAFLWWLAISSIFSFACCHLHIFFGKCLLRSSACFLIRLFFDIELYELFVYFRCQSVIVHIICKYFLPEVCLFILSMVSFALQKLLNLITSDLFIFASVSFALGDRSKKHHCYNLCQRAFCLYSLLKFYGFTSYI